MNTSFGNPMTRSLCETCVWMREVLTSRSRFLLCQLSQTDPAFPKYPPQPVVKCSGYEVRQEADEPSEPSDGDFI